MAKYHRLTIEKRYQIQALLVSGLSLRAVARVLGFAASSITREMKRNSGKRDYFPQQAQIFSSRRREGIGPPKRVEGELQSQVLNFLSKQWSPQQISAHLRQQAIKISHETIYQFVYRDRFKGGLLYLNLRRHRKWRRSRSSSKNFQNVGKRVNQSSIEERPLIVEERKRQGDLERDTMLGKRGGPVLLTIVDRTSRFTWMKKVKKINAKLTHRATLSLLKNLNVQTITNDNGVEFAMHRKTAKFLDVKIYFNDPYSAWQRGTNENTNGLIRQYYPKGFDFNQVTDEQIQETQNLLNDRPRKCLGYKTPSQVHEFLSRVLH